MEQGSPFDAHRRLVAALRLVGPDLQDRAGRAALEWAIARTGLSHPAALAVLGGGPAQPAAALAADLDDRYLSLSEARDEGLATTAQVAVAFGLARAASAAEHVARGQPGEAIYEALHADENWSDLQALLVSMLRTEAE